MKSFLYKANINNNQLKLKYNKKSLHEFLDSYKNEMFVEEDFFNIINRYKRELPKDNMLMKNILKQIINDENYIIANLTLYEFNDIFNINTYTTTVNNYATFHHFYFHYNNVSFRITLRKNKKYHEIFSV
jgi:hypothetical protein